MNSTLIFIKATQSNFHQKENQKKLKKAQKTKRKHFQKNPSQNFRRSRTQIFFIVAAVKISQCSQENPVLESLLNKVAVLQASIQKSETQDFKVGPSSVQLLFLFFDIN